MWVCVRVLLWLLELAFEKLGEGLPIPTESMAAPHCEDELWRWLNSKLRSKSLMNGLKNAETINNDKNDGGGIPTYVATNAKHVI